MDGSYWVWGIIITLLTTLLSRRRYLPFASTAFGPRGWSLWDLGDYYNLVNDIAFLLEVSSVRVDRFRSSWMVAIGSGGLLLPY